MTLYITSRVLTSLSTGQINYSILDLIVPYLPIVVLMSHNNKLTRYTASFQLLKQQIQL